MKSIYKLAIYFSIIVMFTNCVSEIPNASNFEPQVFISGFLTGGTEYVTIKIQQTVPVDEQDLNPINDAQISLFTKDSSGNEELITNSFNVNNGTYESSEMITSIEGSTYWIEIILVDGTTFVSDEEILKPAIIINDIEITNELNRVIFSDPIDDNNFYLINFLFFNNGIFDLKINELTNDVLFNGNDNATFDSTESLVNDPQEVRVSISNLNFNSYQFYLNQFEQFENQIVNSGGEDDPGQLFMPPPANLTGNIMNTTNNTRALGFFSVQSTTQFIKNF
ncbi:DUF4249 domain-containing protein [Flavobacterium litorale]|uniref:DUF4249 domain-containing protein n=1 Tax=Flavobacterium litorale TaxID=2856519 RepID=A0ABX8V6D8_9FLAO|nr:DUF4249 domain-containing protein [Flavobacterium litorale]QYJ68392.1 DUF4249 domain-containing protein [Flavobacterium litorale]